MKEKRHDSRFSHNLIVQFEKISFPLPDKHIYQKSYSADISSGGIAIETDFKIPENDILSVSINLSDGETATPIYAIGTVKYCTKKTGGKYQIGMEFTSIDDQDQEILNNYFQKQKVIK
jgi:hypothetical protein